MPLYEIFHICPLGRAQKNALAETITKLHSTKFTTPRLFVNVVYHDTSNVDTYVAGKHRRNNRIVGTVRQAASRTQADFDALAGEINTAWAEVVHNGNAKPSDEHELRSVFIVGGLIAANEAGFTVPPAGQDKQWAKDNMAAFKEKAASGDSDFADLVKEIESRSDFVNGS